MQKLELTKCKVYCSQFRDSLRSSLNHDELGMLADKDDLNQSYASSQIKSDSDSFPRVKINKHIKNLQNKQF
jgi:hypothetical protein